MSTPYSKGNRWYVMRDDGYEMEFVSYEEAWAYYNDNN